MEAGLEPKQFGHFALLLVTFAQQKCHLCPGLPQPCPLPEGQGATLTPVSVLWHDLFALPLSPHQQKHPLLMSEAFEDPRHRLLPQAINPFSVIQCLELHHE